MNESQRVAWWQALARANLQLQQFGQGNDGLTGGGRRACLPTTLQVLALGWLGQRMTLDTVCRIAGYPTALQRAEGLGMYARQALAFCAAVGLPYTLVKPTAPESAIGLGRRANLYGPVIFGAAYTDWPHWRGFTYRGVTATGKPNGFASPRGRAGKTQLVGFDGGHAGLLLGYHVRRDDPADPRKVTGRTFHVKDPNHGSAIRPERPPFDDITLEQFSRLYASFETVLHHPLYAIVPTEVFAR